MELQKNDLMLKIEILICFQLIAKINKTEVAASKTKSLSTLQSKMRETERARRDLESIGKKRAEIATTIADRSKKLGDYKQKQLKSDPAAQAKIAADLSRLMHQHRALQTSSISATRQRRSVVPLAHDFFISHASEDKPGLVRALVEALEAHGAKV